MFKIFLLWPREKIELNAFTFGYCYALRGTQLSYAPIHTFTSFDREVNFATTGGTFIIKTIR